VRWFSSILPLYLIYQIYSQRRKFFTISYHFVRIVSIFKMLIILSSIMKIITKKKKKVIHLTIYHLMTNQLMIHQNWKKRSWKFMKMITYHPPLCLSFQFQIFLSLWINHLMIKEMRKDLKIYMKWDDISLFSHIPSSKIVREMR